MTNGFLHACVCIDVAVCTSTCVSYYWYERLTGINSARHIKLSHVHMMCGCVCHSRHPWSVKAHFKSAAMQKHLRLYPTRQKFTRHGAEQ